jgi:D-inositol-3-phosphate glycosyltransferase
MKIGMVSEHASPLAVLGGVDAGGQNVHVAELAAALVRRGHRVTVYTRRDDATLPVAVEMPSSVTVVHVDAGPPEPLPKDDLFKYMNKFAAGLRTALIRDRIDVLHAHFWMSGYATLKAARRSGIPVVHTFHAIGSEKRRFQGDKDTSPPERLGIEIDILRRADFVIATASSEIFELSRLGADPHRLRVIPCGVNLSFFDERRSAFPIERGQRYRIACLSRLVERKGLADVIGALRAVPDTELLIGGGGDSKDLRDDPEAIRLQRIASEEGVADRVRLIGRVSRDDVPSFLRSADVVACTPWYEPFGIVPLEAMACSVPVVASSVGGLTDTVVHGVNGYHVPPRCPGQTAHALCALLRDDVLRASFGRRGRRRVSTRFTWDRIAEATEGVYASLSRNVSVQIHQTA